MTLTNRQTELLSKFVGDDDASLTDRAFLEMVADRIKEDQGESLVSQAAAAATITFDAISGATYYGIAFKQILMNDPAARKAARELVVRLKANGARGME
jgi:hypothetical protein